MNKIKSFAITSAFALALAFTFSCSSDDGGSNSSNGDPSSQGGDPSSSGGVGNIESVTIGTQVWMKKNLNVEGGKCYGEDAQVYSKADKGYIDLSPSEIQANCEKYGRLYDWATAMGLPARCNTSTCAEQIQEKHRGICPNGWHIPNSDDWSTLQNTVGSTAGKKLKATSGWNWDERNNKSGNGTDDFGFSALPGGHRNEQGRFNHEGEQGFWWRTIEKSGATDISAFYVEMSSGIEYLDGDTDRKIYMLSVRCIKD